MVISNPISAYLLLSAFINSDGLGYLAIFVHDILIFGPNNKITLWIWMHRSCHRSLHAWNTTRDWWERYFTLSIDLYYNNLGRFGMIDCKSVGLSLNSGIQLQKENTESDLSDKLSTNRISDRWCMLILALILILHTLWHSSHNFLPVQRRSISQQRNELLYTLRDHLNGNWPLPEIAIQFRMC